MVGRGFPHVSGLGSLPPDWDMSRKPAFFLVDTSIFKALISNRQKA